MADCELCEVLREMADEPRLAKSSQHLMDAIALIEDGDELRALIDDFLPHHTGEIMSEETFVPPEEGSESPPFCEYRVTTGQRKAWDGEPDLAKEGWEEYQAWERFDYHEERYWRRVVARPSEETPAPTPEVVTPETLMIIARLMEQKLEKAFAGKRGVMLSIEDARGFTLMLAEASRSLARLTEQVTTARGTHLRRHERLSDAIGVDPGYSADYTIDEAIRRLTTHDTGRPARCSYTTAANVQCLADANHRGGHSFYESEWVGEWRGYTGKATREADHWFGTVLNINPDVATFESDTRADLETQFRASVDDYLDMLTSGSPAPETLSSFEVVEKWESRLKVAAFTKTEHTIPAPDFAELVRLARAGVDASRFRPVRAPVSPTPGAGMPSEARTTADVVLEKGAEFYDCEDCHQRVHREHTNSECVDTLNAETRRLTTENERLLRELATAYPGSKWADDVARRASLSETPQ